MINCLVCQKVIKPSVDLMSIMSFRPLFQPKLCHYCLNLPNIREICHEQFMIRGDYRFKDAFATLYKSKIDELRPRCIVTHASLNDYTYLTDMTAAIVLSCQYRCYSLKRCELPITPYFKSSIEKRKVSSRLLLIDYNGILEEEWEWLTNKVPSKHILRLTILGENIGSIKN